jgi:hypothetical protein
MDLNFDLHDLEGMGNKHLAQFFIQISSKSGMMCGTIGLFGSLLSLL